MTDQAIVPYEQLKTLVKTDETQARFEEVLGSRASVFLASVVSTVYGDVNLRDCEPNTVLQAALKAAILDLPIDPNIGQAYVIGYYNGKAKRKEAQFQMGYKGYIQLALRTNTYESINATCIYQGEEVIEDRLTGRIRLNGRRAGDEVIGYLAYFRLKNGFEKFEYMSTEAVQEHAQRYSKSYGNQYSPWTTHPHEMGKKTVLKRLISKYGPLSVDTKSLQDAVSLDENGEKDDDTIDASFVENREAEEAQEEQPALGIGVSDSVGVKDQVEMPAEPLQDGEEIEAETEMNLETGEVKVTSVKKKPTPEGDSVYEEIVRLGYAANVQSAKAALRGCTIENPDSGDMIAWMKGYRGWLDMGANPQQAAKEMNKNPMNPPK